MPWARGRLAVATAAIVLVIGALYFWTAGTSGDPGRSYHSMLAEGFQHGHAYLPVTPSPELLALPDPYDPAQNAPYRLHDASLYKGRYYLYFGPAPAAVLFLPLRVVGVDIDDRVAAPLMATIGYACAALLLLFLIDRWVPRTPTAWRLVAVAALGLSNVALFMLRRPAVYETSIAAGMMFLAAAALALIVGALRERPSLRLLAAGSLLLGLAVASRANMILAAPLLVWAWWRALGPRGDRTRRGVLRTTVAAGAPLAACLALLALYDAVRFGSPTETGISYQLAGFNPRTYDFFSWDRLVPGAWFYLLQPPHFGLDFPFVTLRPEYPGTLTPTFSVEPVAGILTVTPLLAVLAAVPFVMRRIREERTREMAVLGVVMVAVALLLPLVSILSLGGATERYEVDFAAPLLVPALVAWLYIADRARRPRAARRAVLAVGTAAIAFSAFANLAFGVTGYYDYLRGYHPDVYRRLERIFSFVPTIASELQGKPVITELSPLGVPSSESLMQLAAPSPGVVTVHGVFLPNPVLPPGTPVRIDARGPDGRGDHGPAGEAGTTLRLPLSTGLNDIRVTWRAVGVPPDLRSAPAGLTMTGVRVVDWDPS
jgi:hypothetical protein